MARRLRAHLPPGGDVVSHYDYEVSNQIAIADPPFYALIMAAMRRADSRNLARLAAAFPDTFNELEARYNAPGGLLPTDAPVTP